MTARFGILSDHVGMTREWAVIYTYDGCEWFRYQSHVVNAETAREIARALEAAGCDPEERNPSRAAVSRG